MKESIELSAVQEAFLRAAKQESSKGNSKKIRKLIERSELASLVTTQEVIEEDAKTLSNQLATIAQNWYKLEVRKFLVGVKRADIQAEWAILDQKLSERDSRQRSDIIRPFFKTLGVNSLKVGREQMIYAAFIMEDPNHPFTQFINETTFGHWEPYPYAAFFLWKFLTDLAPSPEVINQLKTYLTDQERLAKIREGINQSVLPEKMTEVWNDWFDYRKANPQVGQTPH